MEGFDFVLHFCVCVWEFLDGFGVFVFGCGFLRLYGWVRVMAEYNQVEVLALFTAIITSTARGPRCSSVVRAFAHGAMGRRIDPS